MWSNLGEWLTLASLTAAGPSYVPTTEVGAIAQVPATEALGVITTGLGVCSHLRWELYLAEPAVGLHFVPNFSLRTAGAFLPNTWSRVTSGAPDLSLAAFTAHQVSE